MLNGGVNAKLRQKMGRVADIFHALDKDHSNTIDQNEFRMAMTSLGFSARDAAEMWSVLDADQSGEIVYHELLAVVEPSRADAKPSAAAMDRNARHAFSYNKQQQESAARQIERSSGVRDSVNMPT